MYKHMIFTHTRYLYIQDIYPYKILHIQDILYKIPGNLGQKKLIMQNFLVSVQTMASPSMKTSSSSSSSKGRTSHLELSLSLLETLEKGGLLSGSLQEAEAFLTEEKFGPFKPKGASKAASAYGLWQKDQTFEKGTTTKDRSVLWKEVDDEERTHYQELADAKNAEEGKEVTKKVSEGLHTSGWTLHQQSLKGSGLSRDEIKDAWAAKSASEKAELNAKAKANNLAKSRELLEAEKALPPVKVPAKAKTKTPTKPKKEKTEKPKKSKKDKEAEAKKLAELAALKEKEAEKEAESEEEEESDED